MKVNLLTDIHEILKKYYGYDSFRKGQEDIINSLISGKGTLEYYIKALPKSDKEYIIQSKSIDILKYLVDTTKYKYEGEFVD